MLLSVRKTILIALFGNFQAVPFSEEILGSLSALHECLSSGWALRSKRRRFPSSQRVPEEHNQANVLWFHGRLFCWCLLLPSLWQLSHYCLHITACYTYIYVYIYIIWCFIINPYHPLSNSICQAGDPASATGNA